MSVYVTSLANVNSDMCCLTSHSDGMDVMSDLATRSGCTLPSLRETTEIGSSNPSGPLKRGIKRVTST